MDKTRKASPIPSLAGSVSPLSDCSGAGCGCGCGGGGVGCGGAGGGLMSGHPSITSQPASSVNSFWP